MADLITKDMNLKELIGKYPETARVFAAYGIGCLGCALAHYETVEQGISAHGIDLQEFLKDINEFVSSK